MELVMPCEQRAVHGVACARVLVLEALAYMRVLTLVWILSTAASAFAPSSPMGLNVKLLEMEKGREGGKCE